MLARGKLTSFSHFTRKRFFGCAIRYITICIFHLSIINFPRFSLTFLNDLCIDWFYSRSNIVVDSVFYNVSCFFVYSVCTIVIYTVCSRAGSYVAGRNRLYVTVSVLSNASRLYRCLSYSYVGVILNIFLTRTIFIST